MKTVVGAGWLLSALVGLAVIYGLTPYFDPVKVPTIDPAVNMTYGPLHRTAWALVIAWIVFACSCGYGGSLLLKQTHATIITTTTMKWLIIKFI